MQIKELLATRKGQQVITVRPDCTVIQAASRMQEAALGCLVVADENEDVLGILSERDIVFRVLAKGGDPRWVRVVEVMTTPVECCRPDSDLSDVQRLMSSRQIRHMPVLNFGQVIGMVSSRDVITTMVDADRAASELAVYSLARLAESRDPETGAHLERVGKLTAALAGTLARNNAFGNQIDKEFISLLRQTSALHDIGKVAVPDYVLLKPDRLTEEEYDIMKAHTRRGAETLDFALGRFPRARFLRMARDIAAHHHERYDGTGYPDGLARTQIPLCARIFSLADVYDALVSKRVYKEAFSHELARNIILDAGGTQFDPTVVQAFQHCERAFRCIRQQYIDQATGNRNQGVEDAAVPIRTAG